MVELTVSTRRAFEDLGVKSGAFSVNASASMAQAVALSGDATLTIFGVGSVTLVVTAGAGPTLSYGGATLPLNPSGKTIYDFYYTGAGWSPILQKSADAPFDEELLLKSYLVALGE